MSAILRGFGLVRGHLQPKERRNRTQEGIGCQSPSASENLIIVLGSKMAGRLRIPHQLGESGRRAGANYGKGCCQQPIRKVQSLGDTQTGAVIRRVRGVRAKRSQIPVTRCATWRAHGAKKIGFAPFQREAPTEDPRRPQTGENGGYSTKKSLSPLRDSLAARNPLHVWVNRAVNPAFPTGDKTQRPKAGQPRPC